MIKTRIFSAAAIIGLGMALLATRAAAHSTALAPDLQSAIQGYEAATPGGFQGVADDSSSHHLVYSRPASGSPALDAVTRDPAYWRQQIRRAIAVGSPTSLSVERTLRGRGLRRHLHTMKRDWSYTLGSGATVGNGMFPAKFSFGLTTAFCDSDLTPDFVAFNTSLAGSSSQPNLVAFDNLYSGCTGSKPLVHFAYNTGGGTVVTSPTLSADGAKLAFVETSSGSHAILRILKWVTGQGSFGGGVWSAHAVDNAVVSWPSCTSGSCVVSLTFNGSPQDTNSSPFYDSANDTIYVGDDSGKLHKFTPVFSGTPAEVTSGGWPVTVHSATVLTSPALDPTSHNVFVGDAAGQLSYVRETGSTAGTCGGGSPPCLGLTTIALGGSVVDGPVVDPSTEKVFWFDAATAGSKPTLTDNLVQTDTALGNQITIPFINNSGSTATGKMHLGAFDNLYLNNASSGHLYVCGQLGVARNVPSLFNIGFTNSPTAGTMNSIAANGPLGMGTTTPANECSPMTEVFNPRILSDVLTTAASTTITSATAVFTTADIGSAISGTNIPANTTIAAVISAANAVLSQAATGTTIAGSASIDTDWVFLGVQANGTLTGCSGACLYSFSVANAFPLDSHSGLTSTGGTSGLSIDNTATSPAGTSQLYFTPLSNQTCVTSTGVGGCATQAAQSGLN